MMLNQSAMKLTNILAAVLLILGACSASRSQEIPKDLEIKFERYPCYGPCPFYSLTIKSDGSVTFLPKTYKEGVKFGTETGQISNEQLKLILSEFEKIKFQSLREEYAPDRGTYRGNPSCPRAATDNPSASISLTMAGKTKSVWHYLGCEGVRVLGRLESFENKIDEIVDSKHWTALYKWEDFGEGITRIQQLH